MRELFFMTGTIINAAAIVGAGLLGLFLRRGIPENMTRTMQDGLGILILVIGLQYGFKAESLTIVGHWRMAAMGSSFGEVGSKVAEHDRRQQRAVCERFCYSYHGFLCWGDGCSRIS
jgi:hypothetical protein